MFAHCYLDPKALSSLLEPLLTCWQLIEVWETYLMQLDAEDGAPVPPVGVVAAPLKSDNAAAAGERPESQGTDAGETQAHAAAEITREMED